MAISLQKQEKGKLWLTFGYCLLVAVGCLLLCSKSSPLYPINDWSDANIYFTVGKGMLKGRLMYRDLYDHKGPLLYALHALCAFISPLSFVGVFLLEALSGALFLFSVAQMLALYGERRWAYVALPFLALAVFSSWSFQSGDSAEELCLPLLGWSLFGLTRYLKTESPKPMEPKTLLLHGVLCGCVLWIKFTLLGFHFAWILTVFLCQAGRRQWKAAWQSLLFFGLGIALATLPWVLYFGVNGAILSWLKTYLYDNLFLYSQNDGPAGLWPRIKAMGKAGLAWGGQNLRYAVPGALGLLYAAFRKEAPLWERAVPWLLFGFTALGVFAGGKTYAYYGLPLAVFTPLCLVPLCGLLTKKAAGLLNRRRLSALAAGACLLAIALCYPASRNTKTSFLKPKETTMQYQLAAVINQTPNATLLNYGFMDAGFYTATGIVPNVKYFHQTNVPLEEMLSEQTRYIAEGLCDYVVTRGRQPGDITRNYDLVATADAPVGYWYQKVYLYRLKTLAAGE